MAASPEWKVHNANGIYKACCKDLEDAGVLAELYGQGATIRNRSWSSKPLWTVGAEMVGPDVIAQSIIAKCEELRAFHAAKRNATQSAHG